MDIAHVDFESVARYLDSCFRRAPPEGPVVGRTAMRDAVSHHLGCSELEAEQIVDTLIVRGRLSFVRLPDV